MKAILNQVKSAWYLDEDGVGAPVGVVVVGEDDGAEAVGVVAMHLVLCTRSASDQMCQEASSDRGIGPE
jgi:hypothetical protein